MRRISILLFVLFIAGTLSAQSIENNGEARMATPISIKANGVTIPAVLNNTMAARDFITRLPFIVSGHRSSVDYCCTAESGRYNPEELQAGWKNGDISLAGGWFAVLFDGEESSNRFKNMMIIGHIAEEYLYLIKGLPSDVIFTVELAE